MSSLPYNLSYEQDRVDDGNGSGSDGNINNLSCPAHPSQECEVRLPDSFDASNTFEVHLQRNSLGLGFSLCGGPSAAPPWAGLVRVKKIFPLQPAWLDGRLRCGDVLVRAGGVGLVGIPLVRALDALRSGPPVTVICVHRPCARHQELDNARLCQTVARSRSFTPATRHGLSLNLSAPLSLSFHTQDHQVIEDEGRRTGRRGRRRRRKAQRAEIRRILHRAVQSQREPGLLVAQRRRGEVSAAS